MMGPMPWELGPGVIELPDRVRGRGLRAGVEPEPPPEWALYVVGKSPASTPWPRRYAASLLWRASSISARSPGRSTPRVLAVSIAWPISSLPRCRPMPSRIARLGVTSGMPSWQVGAAERGEAV